MARFGPNGKPPKSYRAAWTGSNLERGVPTYRRALNRAAADTPNCAGSVTEGRGQRMLAGARMSEGENPIPTTFGEEDP